MRGGSAGGGLHGFGFLKPHRQGSVREQARTERSGRHHPDIFRNQIGHDLVGEARVLQRVLVIAEHAVDARLLKDELENFHRVTAEPDVAGFSGLLDFAQRGDRLVDDLLHRHELDVVTEDDVEMVGAEAMQGNVHALGDAFGGEVEMREVVTPQLGAECVAVTRHTFERDAEENLAHAAAVERRRVDERKPIFERDAHAAERLVEGDAAKLCSERAGTKTEDRDVEISLTETAGLHGGKGISFLVSPAADGEEHVGPQRPVGSLDGENMIGTFDLLVKIPFQNRFERQRCAAIGPGTGLVQNTPILGPSRRLAEFRVGIVGRYAHGVDAIDRDRTEECAQDLRDRDDAGR